MDEKRLMLLFMLEISNFFVVQVGNIEKKLMLCVKMHLNG
jgi:hypothetical protein